MYLEIRDALKAVIETVQVDGSSAFASVATKPESDFAGYPAATLLPASVPSEVATSAQNQREYTFTLHLHISKVTNTDEAITTALKVIDAVLTALDTTSTLGGACNFLRAVPVIDWDVDPIAFYPTIEITAVKAVDVR